MINAYFACEALDTLDIYTTAKHRGTLNISQQTDRMTHGDDERVQCITPNAILWHMPSYGTCHPRDLCQAGDI
jgi:hypothetical protein